MKKILSLALVLVMVLSVVALVGCSGDKEPTGDTSAPLKFGVGITASYAKATDADGETNGEGELAADVVAVLVDADGKIVECVLDTVQDKVAYTSEGKAVELGEFKTKYELGKDYNMATYGASQDKNGDGVVKEWNEQADAFVKAVEGKTIEEAKALVAEDGYGVESLQTAGCTINVAAFIKTLEKAVANAVDSTATADSTLKIGIVSAGETTDVSEEADGKIALDVAIAATALDAENKVVAIVSDAVQAEFTFDAKGVATTDTTVEIKTKKELGKDYNMATYGASQDKNGDGVVKEWFEQAAAFDAACAGKDAAGISALVTEDGYGVEAVQTAGCTIAIGDMVKAAVKAATVA